MIKPFLTALLLPPAGPLLLSALGLLLLGWRRVRALAWGLAWAGLLTLWLLSCQSTAVWLSRHLLHPYPVPTAQTVAATQAVVVLGGGAQDWAEEYQGPDLSVASQARLRHGVWLARQHHLPLMVTGGKGWGSPNQQLSEAEIAQTVNARHQGLPITWLETQSRDTLENARNTAALLLPQGVRRITLVTHATHMQRSVAQFERAGFDVTPAPMGFVSPGGSALLDALPSTGGLHQSRQILHEWLGLRLTLAR